MKLVKQYGERDCGAACLAMVLGLETSQEAIKLLGRDPNTPHEGIGLDPPYIGVLDQEMSKLFFDRDIPHVHVYNPSTPGTAEWFLRAQHLMSHVKWKDALDSIGRGGEAIVAVPSINVPDHGHWLVVRGCRVFDPSNKKTYEAIEQVLKSPPEAIVMISPVAADYRHDRETARRINAPLPGQMELPLAS